MTNPMSNEAILRSILHELRRSIQRNPNSTVSTDQAEAEINHLVQSAIKDAKAKGAVDYITWGYGERCETKDIHDFPEMKDDPKARCACCEEWEHYDEWKKALEEPK